LKPPRLILVAGVDQHHPGHVAGVPDGEPACDDPTDRVPYEQVRRGDSGSSQALPKLAGHLVEGPPSAWRLVAPSESETCSVVHAYPHLPGEFALKS
jgi:hypothetical protein